MNFMKHTTNVRVALTNRWLSKWSVDLKTKDLSKFLVSQDLIISNFIKEFFTLQRFKLLKPIIKRSNNITYIFLTLFRSKKITKNFLVLQKNLISHLNSFTNTRIKIYYSFINNIFFNATFLGSFIVNQIAKKHKPFRIFKLILRLQRHHRNQFKRTVVGLRYEISGRINGVDRGRTLKFLWGSVPLNTLTKNVSFHKTIAYTPEGTLGIKVWIAYKN